MKQELAQKIVANINKEFIGKEEVTRLAVIALLADGHLLLEDVPGVGKTTLAKAVSQSVGLSFSRIQFTPDTLPSDVTGLSVYNMQDGTFKFNRGAVMNHIVLADEVNRTSPKTQACLLEAMQERQITVDGTTYPLEAPFMVIATQNPIDFLGTYNLPEAQLDRFLIRLSVGYPDAVKERMLTEEFLRGTLDHALDAVVTKEDVLDMQKEVREVSVIREIVDYAVSVCAKTREEERLSLGASPRATLALIRASQAAAYLEGRDYVTPDDVQKMIVPVLAHRLVLRADAKIKKITPERILQEIQREIPVPVLA